MFLLLLLLIVASLIYVPGSDLVMGKLDAVAQGPSQPGGLHIFHEKKKIVRKNVFVSAWVVVEQI